MFSIPDGKSRLLQLENFSRVSLFYYDRILAMALFLLTSFSTLWPKTLQASAPRELQRVCVRVCVCHTSVLHCGGSFSPDSATATRQDAWWRWRWWRRWGELGWRKRGKRDTKGEEKIEMTVQQIKKKKVGTCAAHADRM